MSNITVCDKCGVQLKTYGSIKKSFTFKIQNNPYDDKGAIFTCDLCGDCYDKFIKWMESEEDEPEEIDTPAIVSGESQPSDELATPDDAPDYCDCKRMDYAGYSSHDAESHYRCPSCGDDYGSWSFLHLKMYNTVGGKIFQCTTCKTWLRCPK